MLSPADLNPASLPLTSVPFRVRKVQSLVLAAALALSGALASAPVHRGLEWLSSATPLAPAAEAKIDPGIDGSAPGLLPVVVQAVPGREVAAAAAVRAADGRLGSLIPLVHAFPAAVAGPALADLARSDAVRAVTADRSGHFSSLTDDAPSIASSFPVSTGATVAWRGSDIGAGVGVAVIDTGVSAVGDLAGRLVLGPDLSGEGSPVDTYGHGTVMAGLIAGSGADSATDAKGAFVGMAPGTRVISVKAAGADGATDVSTVLAAMSWVSASAAE
ncbi:MAG: S8 family serine peptidase, partial [Acidimicrobiales bacterium]